MTVIDLYSKRQKRLNENPPEVYIYNKIPEKFRIQIMHIVNECFQEEDKTYEKIVDWLQREYGVKQLSEGWVGNRYTGYYSYQHELFDFFEYIASYEQCLDIIELVFQSIKQSYKPNKQKYIDELNIRFKENNLGYRFENNKIIRVDSELLHCEVVKPALQFLSHSDYKNANEEFLSAYESYKKGDYQEANTHCRRAFESTMKIICDKRGYGYNKNKATVSSLLKILKNNHFFPNFTEAHLNNLVGLLQGVGTISNKKGAHGKGSNIESIPSYLTSYLLHATASAILFFSEIERNRGKQ